MKNFSQWSISVQLLLSLGFGVATIFMTSLYLNYQATEERIKAESRLHAKDAIYEMIHKLVKVLDEVESSTSMLAVVAQHGRHSESELTNLLKDIVVNNNSLFGASIAFEPQYTKNELGFAPYFYHKRLRPVQATSQIVDQHQSILYSNLARDDYNYTEQDWYTNAKVQKQPSWAEPYFDEGGGQIYMTTYTVPMVTDEGFYGVVTGDLELQKIGEIVQSVQQSEKAFTLLLDNSLNIISGPKSEFLMKPISEFMGAVSQQKEWSEALKDMMAGEDKLMTLPCPHQTGSCLVAHATISVTSWPLLIIYPEDEMYQSLNKFTVRYTLAALFFIVLLIIAVVGIVRRLTLSLIGLANVAADFGQGDLTLNLPTTYANAETKTLVQAFKKMQIALKEYVQQLKTETAHSNRLEGELSAATQIQMDMLPDNGLASLQLPNLSLWAHVVPAKSVGGDLYHYRLHQNKLTFIVGDVSDKGVPAALFMATTVSLFKQYSQQSLQPHHILTQLNDALEEHNDACMFVTAFVGELDLNTGLLIYSNAGHSAPFRKKADSIIELSQETGPALGLVKGANYDIQTINLDKLDQLIVYTDGVDEAFNDQKQMYGIERLKQHLSSLSYNTTQQVGESIFSAVEVFTGDGFQSDDITVMVIEYEPAFKFLIDDVCLSIDPSYLRLEAKSSSLPQLIDAFNAHALSCGVAKLQTNTVRLVMEEVFVNALHHGQLSLNTVEFYFAYDRGHLLVEMIDSGIAFNPFEDSPDASLGLDIDDVEIGGLGVHLIKSMTQRYAYQRRRNNNHVCVLINCET